jgi:hypothetical protein
MAKVGTHPGAPGAPGQCQGYNAGLLRNMQKNENKQKHDDDDCAEKNCKQPNSGY